VKTLNGVVMDEEGADTIRGKKPLILINGRNSKVEGLAIFWPVGSFFL
jgi:hypothetical protein